MTTVRPLPKQWSGWAIAIYWRSRSMRRPSRRTLAVIERPYPRDIMSCIGAQRIHVISRAYPNRAPRPLRRDPFGIAGAILQKDRRTGGASPSSTWVPNEDSRPLCSGPGMNEPNARRISLPPPCRRKTSAITWGSCPKRYRRFSPGFKTVSGCQSKDTTSRYEIGNDCERPRGD